MRSPIVVLALLALAGCTAALNRPGVQPGEHQSVLNGVRLYYRTAGPGTSHGVPILYLHGGPGYSSHSFAVLAGRRLEAHHTMIYLDQRGSGRSERPWDQAYSVAAMVEDIEALRRALKVPQLVLMGHSFGGVLALEYAARYPQHAARLVLIGGVSDGPATFAVWQRQLQAWHPEVSIPGGPSNPYDRVMSALQAVDGQRFFNALQFRDSTFRVRQDSVDAASGLRNTGEVSRVLFGGELKEYRFSAAERITMPVLIVGGRYDYAIGIETMRALAARLPAATLLEYERSAHFPYLEEADRFERDVLGFLAER